MTVGFLMPNKPGAFPTKLMDPGLGWPGDGGVRSPNEGMGVFRVCSLILTDSGSPRTPIPSFYTSVTRVGRIAVVLNEAESALTGTIGRSDMTVAGAMYLFFRDVGS